MLKAVIFDMDGVLIDSEPVHMEAYIRLMKELNIPYEQSYYSQFIGSTDVYMWEKVIRDFSLSYTIEELKEMSNRYVSDINADKGYPEVPKVATVIKKLKLENIKLAIASSSNIERIHYVLDCMKLNDVFDVIVSGVEVEKPKPEPDTFLKAAQMLGVQPKDCLVIEDSLNGMKAAKAADMVCLGFENFDSKMGEINMEYADYIIQGFEDVDKRFLDMVYCHTKGEP